MISRLLSALILGAALFSSQPAAAVEPNEILADPALEHRAREVGKALRCVVCQNQAIDDSNSELARDMRILVRERIVAGESDQEIIEYMVSRYGDYVLLDPPFKGTTYVLWFGPALIVLIGVVSVVMFYRRRQDAAPATAGGAQAETVAEEPEATPAPLSAEEKKRLDALMKESGE